MNRIGRILLIIGATAAISACGSEVSAEARSKFVEAEAKRQCAIQQNTYPSADALNQAYQSSLETSGLTPEEQELLAKQKASDAKLRADIAERFVEICR